MEAYLLSHVTENIHKSLRAIYDHFDDYCKRNGQFYNIVSDEATQQGYVVKDKTFANKIQDFITPKTEENKVHLDIDQDRRDGVLFTFTLDSIQDGHWKVLSKHPKRQDFSIFANDRDAKKVRAGKTMYQTKGLKERLDRLLYIKESIERHAYKGYMVTPNLMKTEFYISKDGHHISSHSSIEEAHKIIDELIGNTFKPMSEAIAGEMQPEKLEPSSNIGLSSAERTQGDGEKRTIEVQRKDLTDIPTKKLPANVFRPKYSTPDAYDQKLQSAVSSIGETHVIPSDTASKEKQTPTGQMTLQNLRPIGEFGLGDPRQPGGAPVSNVRVSNERNFYGPEIAVDKLGNSGRLGWE